MARFYGFFTLFHLSLTYCLPDLPFHFVECLKFLTFYDSRQQRLLFYHKDEMQYLKPLNKQRLNILGMEAYSLSAMARPRHICAIIRAQVND